MAPGSSVDAQAGGYTQFEKVWVEKVWVEKVWAQNIFIDFLAVLDQISYMFRLESGLRRPHGLYDVIYFPKVLTAEFLAKQSCRGGQNVRSKNYILKDRQIAF